MNVEFGRNRWGAQNYPNTLPAGSRLQNGKYTIVEVYGQGPFSISYLATQNLLNKKVVLNEFFLIKHCVRTDGYNVICQELDATIYQAFRSKWLEEAILLSKCSRNEHFVTVLDAFEEHDTACYVTDYVSEEDLKTYTLARKERHLDQDQAVRMISEICEGLLFLHENNIHHLNLSPIKVLVENNSRAVIFSVGIARQYIPAEIVPDITILARPGYTAPELYTRGNQSGRLADIYSVGAIFYFLLTGKDPVPGPDRLTQPLPEPKSLNPSISPRVNAAIIKALDMDPAKRYQGLQELMHDISPGTRVTGIKKPRKVLMTAAFVVLAIAVIITGGFLYRNLKPAPKEETNQVPKLKVKRQSQLAQLSVSRDVMRDVTMVRDPEARDSMVMGRNYALLIGIQNYRDSRYPKLAQPIHDVTALSDVLVERYTFEKNNIVILKDPSKKEIFGALNYFRDSLAVNDNLFVFYAGHGCYDKRADMGYIIPVDADYKNDADWISFQSIREKFNVITAKHILLIADACFAGSVFRGEDSNEESEYDQMVLAQINRKSRKAFTSAYLNPVPDRSEFLRHLISALESNTDRILMSEDLYINTRNSLLRSTSKKDPVRYGVIRDCGDEGGDFIFIRRTK